MVRFATICPSALPRAPARALAPPPPGTGSLDDRTSRNPSIVFCSTILFSFPYPFVPIGRSPIPSHDLNPHQLGKFRCLEKIYLHACKFRVLV